MRTPNVITKWAPRPNPFMESIARLSYDCPESKRQQLLSVRRFWFQDACASVVRHGASKLVALRMRFSSKQLEQSGSLSDILRPRCRGSETAVTHVDLLWNAGLCGKAVELHAVSAFAESGLITLADLGLSL